MQSIPHSMAHRGAGATRTNARWHPYTPPRPPIASASTPSYALLASSSSRNQLNSAQDSSYLITPAASVYSISPACSTFAQSPHPLPSTLQQAAPQPLRIPQVPKTQPARANYVASLVDQAVKSLSDIWRPENIPAVFSTQTDITILPKHTQPSLPCQQQPVKLHPSQLPSPSSPNTLPSPLPPISVEPPRIAGPTCVGFPTAFLAEHFGSNAPTIVSEKDLVPIKTFVQEVLRRSRTTCSVLQSALCYIEAVRDKVPGLVEREKLGLGVKGESELADRIVRGEEPSSSSKSNNSMDMPNPSGLATEVMSIDPLDASVMPTILYMDALLPSAQCAQNQIANDKKRKTPAKPLPPLPPLPSPLLCPRRTFLAALILASKFLQDRCYSNRAWAKLSGLPPREVGRCERALGDALGWRLWVGKSTAPPAEKARSIQRTKSEGALAFALSPSSGPVNISIFPSPPLSDAGSSPDFSRTLANTCFANNRSLRRAATLPDELAMRTMPTHYRSTSSLPLSFAGPYQAAVAVHQHAALSVQQTILSSTLTSQIPMSSDPTPLPLDVPTPRLCCSPSSLAESALATPNMASVNFTSAFNFSNAIVAWSPAQSTGSNDSSDSSSSASSESIATPPDMPAAAVQCDAARGSLDTARKGFPCVPLDMSDPVSWFTRALSASNLGSEMSLGDFHINGSATQSSISMSMLDNFITANVGLELGVTV